MREGVGQSCKADEHRVARTTIGSVLEIRALIGPISNDVFTATSTTRSLRRPISACSAVTRGCRHRDITITTDTKAGTSTSASRRSRRSTTSPAISADNLGIRRAPIEPRPTHSASENGFTTSPADTEGNSSKATGESTTTLASGRTHRTPDRPIREVSISSAPLPSRHHGNSSISAIATRQRDIRRTGDISARS
jgi:hypothetical protein